MYGEILMGRITIELYGEVIRVRGRGLESRALVVPTDVRVSRKGLAGEGEDHVSQGKMFDASFFESYVDRLWDSLGKEFAREIAEYIRVQREKTEGATDG